MTRIAMGGAGVDVPAEADTEADIEARQRPLLSLSSVGKRYRAGDDWVAVLKDIDLRIDAGEMLAIVGQSGSGKSTLMNILGCLDRPSSGSYTIDGEEIGALDADARAALRREHFGFVFQRYHLLGHLSAEENVEMPAVYRGIAASARRARARALLARLGLADRAGNRPAALSGGQQQRVSIARALMNGGQVILADEPTGALDSRSGADVMAILQELHRLGHTVVIVTHDMHVARIAERIVEIHDGRIVDDRRVSVTSAAPSVVPELPESPELPELPQAPPLASLASCATAPDDTSTAGTGAALASAMALAYAAMTRHRMRTLLTLIGIMMGIASVVSMVAFGQGARDKLLDQIRSFGADAIFVFRGKDFTDERAASIRTLHQADVDLLEAQPYIEAVTPIVQSNNELRRGNVKAQATINGVNERYFKIRNRRFAQGSGFDVGALQDLKKVGVINDAARRALFLDDPDPIGKVLFVGGVPVTIIGVLALDAEADDPMAQLNVFMPVSTVQGLLSGTRHFDYLRIKLAEGASNAHAEPLITRLLTLRHGSQDFFLMSWDKQIKAEQEAAHSVAVLILSIAFVSLLIAGIGVMNIMLVSVTERTAEIGIRMAVGARQADIQRQFLIEALMVCTVGGVCGVILSFAVVWLLPIVAPSLAMRFSVLSIVAACLSATAIGIAFGYVPARNAARLDPIEALSDG